jgi:DNA topoisomerase IB
MLEFAGALPRLRERVGNDLGDGESTERESVLACSVRLLDRGCFRVGGEDYAAENETYGVATLHRSHVTVDGDVLDFHYPAKGGQERHQTIIDAEAAVLVAKLRRRRSKNPELLAYKNGRSWVDVRSDDINAYVKEAAGGDYSAKDFRTWNATMLAAVGLAATGPVPETKTGRKRRINDAVKGVAEILGNTPAVCRSSYIDPRVIDQFGDGKTIAPALRRARPEDVYEPKVQRAIERAVIRLIES